MEPSQGEIDSYSQIPVTFICKTKVEVDQKIWTSNFCLEKDPHATKTMEKEYKYTSVFFFSKASIQQGENPITKVLKMNATGACPRVVLSEGGVQFGKCKIGEKLEKKVTIKNVSNCDVFINSPNLSHFHATPSKFRLAKEEEKEILVSFKPKNLGKIDIKSQFILNKNYPLLFRMVGHGVTMPRNLNKSLKHKNRKF